VIFYEEENRVENEASPVNEEEEKKFLQVQKWRGPRVSKCFHMNAAQVNRYMYQQ
jgi:hypothetical protein